MAVLQSNKKGLHKAAAMRCASALLLLCHMTASPAEEAWLPAAVAEGMAGQVADKMQAIDPSADRAQLLAGGRRLVELVEGHLDDWGDTEVVARSPEFPDLNMPTATQPHLDAINRYQLCNLILELQQANTNDTDARRAGVIASTAVTAAVIYLRTPFLHAGGSMAELEAFVTSPAMEQVFATIQTDANAAQHVAQQCTPVVSALLQ